MIRDLDYELFYDYYKINEKEITNGRNKNWR